MKRNVTQPEKALLYEMLDDALSRWAVTVGFTVGLSRARDYNLYTAVEDAARTELAKMVKAISK